MGQQPACAKACPTHCITFGTKKEMIAHAEGRIADLKSRGFDQAGLYNPPGVGGTHVMYVLHHADQPQIYAGLPAHPQISPIVSAWKGAWKYAGFALFGLTMAGSFFHYLFAGANRVTEEDEANADRLAGGKM
jgi:formate dehydrogenase iron-sulfur subunit